MCVMTFKDADYRLEIWGGSTKRPDLVYKYSDWKYKSHVIEDKWQVYQWLCWIASMQTFPFHAVKIMEYANKHWINCI